MVKMKNVLAQDDPEPLVDLTKSLTLKSKKLERQRKRQEKKASKVFRSTENILDLPYELIIQIVELLLPSEIFALSRTCKGFNSFIWDQETLIAKHIIDFRYRSMAQCFYLPLSLSKVDPEMHAKLQDEERQEIVQIKKKPYQHIKSPDERILCTCMTCLFRWNALNVIVDFHYWQDNLDTGEPIPMIPRGKKPEWNELLINDNAAIVGNALRHPLWHARLLEAHLDSMIRSISRHRANKGNKRNRFRMTDEDAKSGTDSFLEQNGPPTMDPTYHRDNYYLLEAFMPNRSWKKDESRWVYMPLEMHDRDLLYVLRVAEWRRSQKEGEEKKLQHQHDVEKHKMVSIMKDLSTGQSV